MQSGCTQCKAGAFALYMVTLAQKYTSHLLPSSTLIWDLSATTQCLLGGVLWKENPMQLQPQLTAAVPLVPLRSTKGSHLPCGKDVGQWSGRYPRILRGATENKQQITAFMLPTACPDGRWDITRSNEDLVLWEHWLLRVSPLEQSVRALLWRVTTHSLISWWKCTQTENSYFSCIF